MNAVNAHLPADRLPLKIYQALIRPLIFSAFDPEWMHHRTLHLLSWLDDDRLPSIQSIVAPLTRSLQFSHPSLTQTLWGVNFANPLGLAAGFDKDGEASGIWVQLGFGFTELGTVTQHAQPGSDRPRLFRLVADRAVLNRMGFNNQGAAAMAERLAHRWQDTPHPIPIGINLGKSKVTPLVTAAADYCASFRLLYPYGDYFVVNVSSPNTPGLRSLQAAESLSTILDALQQENQGRKPLLVKFAPDLEWDALAEAVAIAQAHQVAGIIATNTTIRRDGLTTTILPTTGKPIAEEAGGISGAPLKTRSTEVIRFIWQQTQGKLPIIGVGGIFTPEDAWEKITAGASLLQVYTGLVYEGPWMVRGILEGLAQRLHAKGLTSIAEAVGTAN